MPPDYWLCVVLSVAVAAVVAFGVPIGTALLLRRETRVLAAAKVPSAVSAYVATELGLERSSEAVELMHEVELGQHYGFLLEAFRPSCYCWELLDMLRKMALVGVMVICVPGSTFQIWVAALISLVFLVAHFKSWPYKLAADNLLKAIIEMLD